MTVRNVCLVNRDYSALSFITARQAVIHISTGKALPLETAPVIQEFRTVTRKFIVRSILVMKRYIEHNVFKRAPSWSKKGVIALYNSTCAYCGTHPGMKSPGGKTVDINDMTVDHVIPMSRGGKSSWENTVAACVWCNSEKADKTLSECGFRLKYEIKVPSPAQFLQELRQSAPDRYIKPIVSAFT